MIKKVALINDLSGFGKCSLTAALPVLSVLGIQSHPIPTMVLTGQGGYSTSFRTDLTETLPDYTNAWRTNHAVFDGIYTGYMTGPEQIAHILKFIKTFRNENTFLLVDPVMGDNGHTYKIYSEELLMGMKELSQQADFITPNLTEACLLSDTSFEDVVSLPSKDTFLEKVVSIANKLREKALCKQDVVITGVRVRDNDKWNIYNVALTERGISLYPSNWFNKSFSGTGDLLASALCGLKLNEYTTEEALDIAGKFIYHSISDAIDNGVDENEGVSFEKHLKELIIYAR